MVQNLHYGSRDDLPFDLKHKAGPIQYSLAPGDGKPEIATEKAKLKGQLIAALRPYLLTAMPQSQFPKLNQSARMPRSLHRKNCLAELGTTPRMKLNIDLTSRGRFIFALCLVRSDVAKIYATDGYCGPP